MENKLQQQNIEHDFVTGSNSEFPYQLVQISIEGIADNTDRIHRLEGILRKRKGHVEELQLEVEEFIASIKDSFKDFFIPFSFTTSKYFCCSSTCASYFLPHNVLLT